MKITYKNKKITKRIVSVVISAAILTNSIPFPGGVDIIGLPTAITASAEYTPSKVKDEFSGNNFTFNDINTLIDYSYYYQNDEDFAEAHESDSISIAITSGDTALSTYYLGLGSATHPFSGTVTFGSTGSYTMRAHRAFFSYLSDSAVIKGTDENAFKLVLERLSDVGDNESTPVLADHVVHDQSNESGEADWNIEITGSHTFSGAIGEICEGAKVNLTFTDNTNNSIVSNVANEAALVPDVGTVCGTMKKGSSLTLTYNGAITSSITSANGNAGGLVGTMEDDTVLNIITPPSSLSPTVTANCSEDTNKGYAGGLVGEMNSSASVKLNSTTNLSTLSVGGKVIGSNGAGGLYGHYTYKKIASVDINDYNISASVYGKYCGGLFGVLETENDLTITNTDSSGKAYKSDTGSDYDYTGYFGGIAGKFKTTALSNTLTFENLSVNPTSNDSFCAFGGVIGIVDSTAYVKVDNVTVEASGTDKRDKISGELTNYAYFGGLVGATSGTKGVFVDVGNFTLNTSNESFCGGGIVGQFNNGVLRFSGTTDMTAAKPDGGYSTDNKVSLRYSNYGQLVGTNDNVLVYALGDGTDDAPAAFNDVKSADNTVEKAVGWRYLRFGGAISDDLGTWGEVVRMFKVGEAYKNAEDAEIVSFDSAAHTVTLAAAKTSIGSSVDFAKTALNIMLNQGKNYDSLLFTEGDENKRDTLLGSSSTLTLTENINLSKTGINGFMRDGSDTIASDDVGGVGAFTGTLDGNNKTITFATGESYGVYSNDATEGTGQIYRHQYTGLFAVIGNSDTAGIVKDLTINGTVRVHNAGPNGMSIGGIAARSHGSTTLDGITANQAVNYYEERTGGTASGSWGKYLGGLIGFTDANTDNGTIAIKGSTTLNTTFNFERNPHTWIMCGGAIGAMESDSIKINFAERTRETDTDACTVSMNVNVANNGNIDSASCIGGLIGYIHSSDNYKGREVNIDNTTFGTEEKKFIINNNSTTNAGGLLGFSWYDATVNIKGITVANAELNYAASNVGVMCYDAAGKWTVDLLKVNGLTVSGGGTSLGMLVNKAYNKVNNTTYGLYLDVLNSGYTLNDGGITLPSSLKKYDEIAAYSAENENGVLTGGAGVISINMNTDINGTETKITETGTYQNQLSVTSTTQTSNYANDTSRYYYNLDKMSPDDAGQNLLLWSVNKYAASNINSEFNFSDSPLSYDSLKEVNLTGLSFYPLYNADNYTLNNLALTFDYSGIYTKENENSGGSDNYIRDPGAANQHYLMHSGLFINVPTGTTVTIGGELSLAGTFLEVDNYKGVLISDTMNGNFTCDSGSIKLNGIKPMTTGNAAYIDGYLLINNITRESDLVAAPKVTIKNLSTTSAYSVDGTTATVAKSLIGAATGKGLSIEFSGIKLDARDGNSTDEELLKKALDLFNAYGTYNSIFTDSTLLASINTDQTATLVYNYTYDEDWGTGTPRNVTYGKEVTSSIEYPSQENRYYGEPRNYTNPISDSNTEYDFSTGFLPYVKTEYSSTVTDGKNYRELKVNVMTEGLKTGCGTYNDPYIITDGNQLRDVAKFISSGETSDLSQISLPKRQVSGITNNAKGNRWCTDKSGDGYHAVFKPNDGATGYYKDGNASTNTDWTKDNVRYYLANAYYKISGTIELDNTFVGLGGKDANFAFRGVIVGEKNKNGTPMYTITNNSSAPFIKVSNGCVVKDVNIVVAKDNVELDEQKECGSSKANFDYNSKCAYYGGIIGEIMGGDNIIDNSYVSYNAGSKITLSGAYGMLCPVGSYVGVVVFGGLIFKNINKDTANTNANSDNFVVNFSGNDTNLALESSKGAIYVNPLVGRVINGYAVNETTQFSVTEDGHYHDDENTTRTGTQHSLKNTTKHYTIADIDPSLDKLDVSDVPSGTGADQDGKINIPNSQAFFVLSLITQSCAGTAPSAFEKYSNSLSYGTNTTVYGMSHIADYDEVGIATDEDDIESDYALASQDTAENKAVPYIIKRYTKKAEDTTSTEKNEVFTGNVSELDGRSFYISNTNGSEKYFGNNMHPTEQGKLDNTTDINSDNTGLWTFESDNSNTYRIFTNVSGIKTYMCMSDTNGDMSLTDSKNNATVFTVLKSNNKFSFKSGKYFVNRWGGNDSSGFKGYTSNDAGSQHKLTEKEKIIPIKGGYNARCVTTSKDDTATGYYNINLKEGETYQLPDSFRGLGAVGKNNLRYNLKVDVFDGKGCSIDEDIYLNRFYNNSGERVDNYFDCIHNVVSQQYYSNNTDFEAGKEANNHGIGLFDSIFMKDDKSKLYNFILSGSVNTEHYLLSKTFTHDGEELIGIADKKKNHWLVTGGVCGWSPKDFWCTFEKINLKNLTVSGSTQSGGLLAASGLTKETIRKIVVNECNADEISIEVTCGYSDTDARCAAGGFIGKIDQGKAIIDGGENGSFVKIKSIKPFDNIKCVAGGIVAYAGNGCECRNMTVCPADSLGKNASATIGKPNNRMAGGIVGLMQPEDQYEPSCVALFENCKIERINIYANYYAGGLYGGTWNNATGEGWITNKVTVKNCSVIGNENDKNIIKATNCAGGIIADGLVYSGDSPNIEIGGCEVSNYKIINTTVDTKITARNKAEGVGVGGFIGFADAQESRSSATCYIYNSAINNCEITSEKGSAGGVIGQITKSDAHKILGYNIKLNNVTSKSTNMGAWVGYMDTSDTKTSIQFSGMAIYGQGFNKNIGNWEANKTISNASFVFADYDGMCNNNVTADSVKKSSLNYDVNTHVEMPKYPYVNINPQSKMGTSTTTDENGNEVTAQEIITGDGSVLNSEAVSDFSGNTAEKTMAAKIYADLSDQNNSRRYTTFIDTAINGTNTIDYYMKRTVDEDGDRISTYKTERGSLPDGVEDFAVVVIANTNDTETTNLINRYIQLVTNTSIDYAADNAYFKVDIKTCKYEDGSFSVDSNQATGTTGLILNGGQFKLNSEFADSKNSNTFTLVDVQFLDPLGKEKIAYHLYVPVYTIKEMAVNFYAVAKTGSHSVSYESGNASTEYSSLMNADVYHADSLETWMTHYIRYEYQADDINSLLNSGKVQWNYKKSINFETITTGDDDNPLPKETYFALVDPNGNSDQVYYAKAEDMNSYDITGAGRTKACWTVDLSTFKNDDDKNFTVASFNKMIAKDIIVNENSGNGKYDLMTSEQIDSGEKYDIYCISAGGEKSYYKFNNNNNGDYDLNVADDYTLCEDYYISIYVPRPEDYTNELYHYSVISPIRLGSNEIVYSESDPKIRSAGVTQPHECYILVADLFKQTLTDIERMTVTPDNEQITPNNKTIRVKVSTLVEPNNPSGVFYLQSNNHLFHSFYISLIRKSENGIESDIKGLKESNIKAFYSIDSEVNDSSTSCTDIDLNLKDNYLNIQTASSDQSAELIDKLRSNKKFEIYAEIEMDFDEESLTEEFPERDSSETFGVNVKAASNLAYESSTLAYTSMTMPYKEDRHNYYIESVPSAKLIYSSKKDDTDQYDMIGLNSKNQSTLGINGKAAQEANRNAMPVNTEAFYNVQSLSNSKDAKKLYLTFALSKKTDTGNGSITGVTYEQMKNMENYLDGTITFTSGTATYECQANGESVTAVLDVDKCNISGDIYDIVITFNAKTGDGFAEYTNYKVDLKAELYYDDNEENTGENNVDNSVAQDYLIYTNAKVHAEVIR